MTVEEILHTINGNLVCGEEYLNSELKYGFASDLMSDVLTLTEDGILLISGLTGLQVVRTGVMSDIHAILFVRGKKVTQDMKVLAKEHDMVLMECRYSMFKTSGHLYMAGLEAVF